jgi:hypothetical protein
MRRSSRHAKQSPGYYAKMVNGGGYCGEDDAGSSESGSSEEELVPTSEKVVASEEQEEDFEATVGIDRRPINRIAAKNVQGYRRTTVSWHDRQDGD